MLRDCTERGRDVRGVLRQYHKFVKPCYDEYIKPTMKHANIIIPFGSDNTAALDFIVQNLVFKLEKLKLKPVVKEEHHYTLNFELVDYYVDYMGLKNHLRFY